VESLIRTAATNFRATGKTSRLGTPTAKTGRQESEPITTEQFPFGDRPGGAR
jgi:hypothetical protein